MANKSGGAKNLVQLPSGVWVPESIVSEQKAAEQAAAAEKVASSKPTESMNKLAGKKMGSGKIAAFAVAAAAAVALGVGGYKYLTSDANKNTHESAVKINKDGKAEIIKSNANFTSIALMNAFSEIQKGNGSEIKARTGLDMAATSAVLQTIQRNEPNFLGQLDTKGAAVATLVQPNPLVPRFNYKAESASAEEAAKSTIVTVKLSQAGFDFAVAKPDSKPIAMHFDNSEYAKMAFAGINKEKAPAPKVPKPSNSGPS